MTAIFPDCLPVGAHKHVPVLPFSPSPFYRSAKRDTPCRSPFTAAPLLLALLFGMPIACDSDPADVPDATDVIEDAGFTDDLPRSGSDVALRMDLRCDRCHLVSDLTVTIGDDSLSASWWMANRGRGLTRFDHMAPLDADVHYKLDWPSRGRHPSVPVTDCATCHPVYADGRGHTASAYPEAALLLAHADGGQDCAEGCHEWLLDRQMARGLPGEDGRYSFTEVPGRPSDLLTGSENAHAAIWREGHRPLYSDPAMRAGIVAPGCAGCHNLGIEGHGVVSSCIDCHAFGGPGVGLHDDHLGFVEAGRALNDPSRTDRDPCLYCHNTNDPDTASPDLTYRAACYNCHLSGHQPLDADGQAHFWPL